MCLSHWYLFPSYRVEMLDPFFTSLRPEFKVQLDKHLSITLLRRSYRKMMKSAEVYLSKTNCISSVIDGWTDIRKDAVINIIPMTPFPVFFKSIDTKGEEDVKYMKIFLDEIILEFGAHKISGLISDKEQKCYH